MLLCFKTKIPSHIFYITFATNEKHKNLCTCVSLNKQVLDGFENPPMLHSRFRQDALVPSKYTAEDPTTSFVMLTSGSFQVSTSANTSGSGAEGFVYDKYVNM